MQFEVKEINRLFYWEFLRKKQLSKFGWKKEEDYETQEKKIGANFEQHVPTCFTRKWKIDKTDAYLSQKGNKIVGTLRKNKHFNKNE